MSRRRRWEKLDDFVRGLSLAGAVALSAGAMSSMAPIASLAPVTTEIDVASFLTAPFSHPVPPAPLASPRPETRVATIGAAPDRFAVLDRGETLGALLTDLGVPAEEIGAVVSASKPHLDPRALQPGLRLAAFVEQDRTSRLQVALAGRGELTLARGESGWQPTWRAYERDIRRRSVRGTVEGSFDRSLAAAGAEPELAYAMADVLQWDLDFTRDLQKGDRFETLFEEVYLEGERYELGRVLAIRYEQPRRTLEVFHYGDGDAYYDAEGRPLEKMFLRAPLPYSRVTSGFSARRFHPVLKIARPHYGVDYGAPVGTPVRVTANGTVVSAGWDGGGGKTVKVRHANGFLTAYLHLSRFASGISAGARVSQGEVIAYVGATGLATGPHLDYRVQQNGRWIDPLSLKSVPAEPISSLARADFESARDAMRVALAGESAIPKAPPASVVVAARAGAAVSAGAVARAGTPTSSKK